MIATAFLALASVVDLPLMSVSTHATTWAMLWHVVDVCRHKAALYDQSVSGEDMHSALTDTLLKVNTIQQNGTSSTGNMEAVIIG
jgi:hypothetical protein